jgi:hypothetical protein
MPLPLSKDQSIKAITWMKQNFSKEIEDAVNNTPFSLDIVCGIACQETAYVWIDWIGKKSVDEILSLCVFDASGDFPDTKRSAFPKNTDAFRSVYGDEFTNMLIEEANRSRKERGLSPKSWVYKGYGIYQYDLQYVKEDEAFFKEKQWFNYSKCLEKAMKELTNKWKANNDLFKAVRAYNGSGPSAQDYANNVMIFNNYSKEVSV